MTDFDSPEMRRALAADQEKLDGLMSYEEAVVKVAIDEKLALMRSTMRLVITAVKTCMDEAVIDEVISPMQAEDLSSRFTARVQESVSEVIDGALTIISKHKIDATLPKLLKPGQ